MIFDMTKRKSGGGGYTADDWLDPTKPVGEIESEITGSPPSLSKRTGITGVRLPNSTGSFSANFFLGCSACKTVFAPKVWVEGNALFNSNVETIVINRNSIYNVCGIQGDSHLKTVDMQGNYLGTMNAFSSCPALDTIILRYSSGLVPLPSGSFSNSPFKSGGTGGTIYIPKSLYDHLGDGTANDYKAATNWSTYDGYGTITWAKIEGSIYETQYADGTPIPTT